MWLSGTGSACQCRRCGFNPWAGTIPWRWKWQHTPVFSPGKSHRQRSLLGNSAWGRKRVGQDLAAKQQQGDDQAPKDNFLLVLISIYSNHEGWTGSEKQLQAKGSLTPSTCQRRPTVKHSITWRPQSANTGSQVSFSTMVPENNTICDLNL